MVDIVAKNTVSVSKLMGSLELYKYNPTAIQRVSLDYLEAVTNAEVDIVDPTNPFVFLLETSAVQTALAVNETRLALRKQYPSLSQNEDEVYMHMSDKDFSDRFATPAESIFTFIVNVNSFITHAVDSPDEGCHKVTIPRNTEVVLGSWTFSLEYPIDIRRFYNGMVQVTYDTDKMSPLRSLSTNVIDYVASKTADGVYLLKFKVPLSQFVVESTEFPVQVSTGFSQTVTFSDNYYYCRVFYKKEKGAARWVEMNTTHTDQVYDIYRPTAVLKVLNSEQRLTVGIPNVYLNNKTVDGTVRVDVYTTKGPLSEDLSSYQITAFTTTLRAVDELSDINVYTAAMSEVMYMAYSDDMVTGGSSPLSFLELRNRVINNAVGVNELPITNAQLVAFMERKGFEIVKNVDVITNRIFVATKNLPPPSNRRLITAANLSIETFVCNLDKLIGLPGVSTNSMDNPTRWTIHSNTLFEYYNGFIEIVPQDTLQQYLKGTITKLASLSKEKKFLYTPFYYVLDNSNNEFDMRAYHLDQPALTNLSFVSQNPTALLEVNTGSYSVAKTTTGYKITIVTKSGSGYKQLMTSQVGLQMSLVAEDENYPVFLMAKEARKINDERVYEFDILCNHDIDGRHRMYITNFQTEKAEPILVPVSLSTKINLFYTTSSVPTDYRSSPMDLMLGSFQLPSNSVGITHEIISVTFGHALTNLWAQTRSVADAEAYLVYEEDVPMYYEEDVYETDPTTGLNFKLDPVTNEPVFTVVQKAGDMIYHNGEQVFKHRRGDPILGLDLIARVEKQATDRHCDMLFVDGCYYLATDTKYKDYLKELANVLDQWIYTDLGEIDSVLLEQTKMYYYPKKTVGSVEVMLNDDSKVVMPAEQSLNVILYVRDVVFKDMQLREEINRKTVIYLNEALQKSIVSISTIMSDLKALYSNSVVSFKVWGLGGEDNYDVVSIVNQQDRLCLKKHLVPQEDGTLVVAEDITINYVNFTQS